MPEEAYAASERAPDGGTGHPGAARTKTLPARAPGPILADHPASSGTRPLLAPEPYPYVSLPDQGKLSRLLIHNADAGQMPWYP